MGGAARFSLGKDSKVPLKIGLGMLAIGIFGSAIGDAHVVVLHGSLAGSG
jgi:hypothetical protein